MDQTQAQKNLQIIKDMIEKTKKETAESGYFFIFIGIFAMIMTYIISLLSRFHLPHLIIPAMIFMLVGSGIIGYLTINRKEKRDEIKSYPKTISYSVWFACSVSIILTTFVFPFINLYPFDLVPVFASLFIGVAVFSTGVIFEFRAIILCSISWWAGAVLMAYVNASWEVYIMLAVIFLGWILPGLILNKKYRSREIVHEA